MTRTWQASTVLTATLLSACGAPREARHPAPSLVTTSVEISLAGDAAKPSRNLPKAIGAVNGCTATLIDRQWLVTADHCIGYLTQVPHTMTAQFGSERRRLDLIVRHPGADGAVNMAVDVALARLESPIDTVTPLSFLAQSLDIGQAAAVMGTGREGDPNKFGPVVTSHATKLGGASGTRAHGWELTSGTSDILPCVGDGAALVKVREDGAWQLAGVVNALSSADCKKVNWAHAIDLTELAPWIGEETGIALQVRSVTKDIDESMSVLAHSCQAPKASIRGNKLVKGHSVVTLNVEPERGVFYQWRVNGVDLPKQRSSLLRFTANRSATYQLIATNECGVTARSMRIVVR